MQQEVLQYRIPQNSEISGEKKFKARFHRQGLD